MRLLRPDTPDTVGGRWIVMQLELQISKEMTIWDDKFKYVNEVGIGVGRPNKTFKGKIHLEPHLGFHLSWRICISSTLPKSTFIFNTQQYQQNKSP